MEEVSLQVEGTRVFGRAWSPKGKARGGVVLLHGFNASIGEFGDLGASLAQAGYLALAIDQRGHGRSAGERGLFSLDRAMQDVGAAVAWLRDRLGRRRQLALIGHSLGGALAVGIAARTRWFTALVVAHPVDRLLEELDPVSRVGFHALGRIGRWRARRGHPAGMVPRPTRYATLYVDAAAARRAAREPYLDERVNLGSYTFAATMEPSRWATQVRISTLAVLGDNDKRVKPAHSVRVVDALGGHVERLHHAGGHACFRDLDHGKVTTGIVAFLRNHLEAP